MAPQSYPWAASVLVDEFDGDSATLRHICLFSGPQYPLSRLAEPYPLSAPVFFEKLNIGGFDCIPNFFYRALAAAYVAINSFQTGNRRLGHAGFLSQICLGPSK